MSFEEFFSAIYGYAPFPWQCEAARRALAGDDMPVISVPTASGKTALVDVALFAAAQGGRRHIAFVIDRRVVVDEAYARAQRIAEALGSTEHQALREIAAQLGAIQVVRLRGGVHGDDDWVLYPDKVTVLVSTVDQIGSRLLHRGYGVSSRMAPLHAGFVGNDALYIVDEGHLSTCFLDTVKATVGYGADVRTIAMTATPDHHAPALTLGEDDLQHPVLKQRLEASKVARLIEVTGNEAEFCKAAVESALVLAEGVQVVGIVVNRVNSARRIWRQLAAGKRSAVLLTGRVRAHDRDALMQELWPRICAGRDRLEAEPVFVVATQAIEVGADIDFDALVTEAAPLGALRQRFGRLDRLGSQGQSAAVIVQRAANAADAKRTPDPIYGMEIHATWNWLIANAENDAVDFGIAALRALMQSAPPPASVPAVGPALLPSHMGLLAQTGPYAPELDVTPWLHGPACGTAEVTLVWRADLDLGKEDLWAAIVRLRPPMSREAMEVPLYAARAWLQGRRAVDVADLEGAGMIEGPMADGGRTALCWRGVDDSRLIAPTDIKPGDTLVVPAAYGGCDRFGWFPESDEVVADLADLCSLELGRGHAVRLVPGLTDWLGASQADVMSAVAEVVAAETQIDLETGVDQERIHEAHTALRALLQAADNRLIQGLGGRYTIECHPGGAGVILRGKVLDDIGAGYTGGVAVPLDAHLANVAERAFNLAGKHPQREKIRVAGREHDLGKREARFQSMLHGDPVSAAQGPLLAKSGLRRLADLRAAYAQSGLPAGFRHELASLTFSEETDPLVRYLIATHHGFGRPWFPACADPAAPGSDWVLLGSGWSEVRGELLEEHGPWVLAGMELLLRAADARQSMAEQDANHA